MAIERQQELPIEASDYGVKPEVSHLFTEEASGDPQRQRYAGTPIEDGIVSGSCGSAELALLYTSPLQ